MLWGYGGLVNGGHGVTALPTGDWLITLREGGLQSSGDWGIIVR